MVEPVSLASYFDEIVRPTVHEYFDDPSSRRKCMLACIVLIHVWDALSVHGFSGIGKDATNFFKNIIFPTCPEAKIVFEVGTTAKHIQTKHAIGNYSDVEPVPPTQAGSMMCGAPLDPFGGVYVRTGELCDGDDYVKIYNYIQKTFEFLEEYALRGLHEPS